MSPNWTRDHENRSDQGDGIHPAPEAESSNTTLRTDRSRKQKGASKKRDTHFLCFPLVTEASIPQLAKSLRHFRDITTISAQNRKHQPSKDGKAASSKEDTQSGSGVEAESVQERVDGDITEGNVNHLEPLPTSNPDLQILPAITHRPPGTFHLTMGVMDLSTKEEMDRALNLLQELDYAKIFDQVVAQHSDAYPPQRTRKEDEIPTNITKPPNQDKHFEAEVASLDRPISPPPKSNTSPTQTPDFSGDKPPRISLTGLSTFPSAKTSRVFYAKPSPTPSSPFPLLELGRAIRRRFREAGFITETRPLVLHATVANMRYAVQPKGGRTSKGKTWRYGKDRWADGQVDARELIKCFDYYGGDVAEYTKGDSAQGEANEFIWAKNIDVNRVAICKMGAEKSDDEVLGMVYPPVGEKIIFS